jgi:hypothetical protein
MPKQRSGLGLMAAIVAMVACVALAAMWSAPVKADTYADAHPMTGDLRTQDLYPDTANTYDLGTSALYWRYAYIGIAKMGYIKALDGTSSWTIASSTGKSTCSTAVRVESLGVGVAADDTAGNAKVNAGLGVGSGQAAGADGVAKVKTAVDTPALRALDGTACATIANSTGKLTFSTQPQAPYFIPTTATYFPPLGADAAAPSTGAYGYVYTPTNELRIRFASGAVQIIATMP